jgi:hypothetical protein
MPSEIQPQGSMTSPSRESVTHLPTRACGLEINAIEGGFMIYQSDRNRVHYLNHTAVLVLELCNGENSVATIAERIKRAYGLANAPEAEVREIIAKMQSEALLS